MISFPARLAARLLILVCLLGGVLHAHATANDDWPVTAEGLRPDPNWRWGRLPNGLRYVVRRNALPRGHVSYRLAVEVGAAHETPEEQGFAHFVEHMAFNGTRNHPGESLDAEMEKRGIALGPEVSAFTFLSHTIYNFDAPSNAPADIDWLLTVLRDFADGQLFESKQVKRERGVVASEMRDRDSVAQRFDHNRRQVVYPQSSLNHSITGDPEKATARKLEAFYRKWYRADRMILAIVGDADPEALEASILKRFTTLAKPSGPVPSFDPGFLEDPSSGTTSVIHDPNSGGLVLEVVSVSPNTTTDGQAVRRRFIAASIATQILQERMQSIMRLQPKVYNGGWAHIQAPTPFAMETSVAVQGNSREWEQTTTMLETELRRSFEYTFFPAEIAEARQRLLVGYEQYRKSAITAQSSVLASWVVQEALWHTVSASPSDQLELVRTILPQIDMYEINTAWRSYWQQHRARIFAYGYFPVAQASELIRRVFERSSSVKLDPPRPPAGGEFAYTDFGPAGRIVSRRHVKDVDMHLIEFANGIRVNLKRTDFETNIVYLATRLGDGLLTEPQGKAGLGALSSLTLLNSGLGRHSPEQLRHLLGAEPVSLQFSANEASFAFSGSAATQRLERLLQLLCAYLTDPAWDPKAFEAATQSLVSYHNDLQRTSEGVLTLAAFRAAAEGDTRYVPVSPAELGKIDLPSLRDWLEPQLRQAPLEIGIVGDFQLEETVELLSRTLGALPVRSNQAFPVRAPRFHKSGGEHREPVLVPCPRSALQVMWSADQGRDVHLSRRLEVLGAMLGNRLFTRIREDLGAAYSPAADFWKSDTETEEGYLIARLTTAPEAEAKVTKSVLAAADQLARQGATAKEFNEAIAPIRARCESHLKDNSYWLWRIALCAQTKPEVLDWPLTRTADYDKVTVEEINHLAAGILTRDRALLVSASPARK